MRLPHFSSVGRDGVGLPKGRVKLRVMLSSVGSDGLGLLKGRVWVKLSVMLRNQISNALFVLLVSTAKATHLSYSARVSGKVRAMARVRVKVGPLPPRQDVSPLPPVPERGPLRSANRARVRVGVRVRVRGKPLWSTNLQIRQHHDQGWDSGCHDEGLPALLVTVIGDVLEQS